MIKLTNITNDEIQFSSWKFPAGEVGVKLSDFEDKKCYWIVWSPQIDVNMHDEFFIVANLVNALNHKYPACKVYIDIKYLPYARQDRVCHEGESFGLQVFANMLKSTGASVDLIYDPHSIVSVKETHGIEFRQESAMREIYKMPFDMYVAPDKGAAEKIRTDMKHKTIFLNKVRVDGKVIHEDLPSGTIPAGSKVCIVDDISDGNGTFVSCAKAILKNNPDVELHLAVTHGIFNRGLDNLRGLYKKVYCYNLMNQSVKDDPLLTVLF